MTKRMFACYLMPLLQIDPVLAVLGCGKPWSEITYAIVDLKKYFAELDGAITYQVRAPKILPYPPFETKLSYMKLP